VAQPQSGQRTVFVKPTDFSSSFIDVDFSSKNIGELSAISILCITKPYSCVQHFIVLTSKSTHGLNSRSVSFIRRRKAEHLDPAGACRNLTDYYLSKGDIGKARKLCAKFVKLQPTNPWVTT
jgi:hypothetical protein